MDPVTGRPVKKPTSPWVWIGCGCGALVVLAMAGMAGLTWFGYREAKQFEKNMTDPAAREAKVKSVIHYDELPPGYYPLMGFSIPFIMDMAIFTDKELPAGQVPSDAEGFEDHGFFYMRMLQSRGNKEEMQRMLRGEKTQGESPWSQSSVNFDEREVIRRGTVEVDGTEVLYSAARGELKQQNDANREGVVAMVLPDCPADNRLGFGLWFGRDPDPTKPAAEIDWTGTPADPEALKEFLGHFRLCRGKE